MIAFFRSRSIVRMTVRPRTCGYTRVPYQKRLRGITNSPLSMRPFPFDFDTCTYLSFPSLIALRISISTLTAGYLILASDDNIGIKSSFTHREIVTTFSFQYGPGRALSSPCICIPGEIVRYAVVAVGRSQASTCVIGARREVPASALTCGSADLRPGSCMNDKEKETLESFADLRFGPSDYSIHGLE
ncbi:hypothetical protein PCH_Pc13g02610 [Penicillium rubens Wisconsin 54-1255]|uniref:Uncharacterized protein n=1 Tax=Penicillium rubens (strain ATCC 28089 / DSM 1075 / NRRL 1951 / Wisconsin 54-1255) TaxID=500485 RepID=B6H1E7_PENRW|nr:hypothetical protein PCH_Pc13g02610 [Penicillium rubens Wisconsin 54-1255]